VYLYIYIKYIIFRRRYERSEAARRLIIPMGGVCAWKTGRGLTPASQGEGELVVGTSGAASRTPNESSLTPRSARVQRIILYATLKVIFNCHPAALSTTMTSTIPHAKNRITAIYNNIVYYIYHYGTDLYVIKI